jgi:ACS family allantoate permease-like MFS transporter
MPPTVLDSVDEKNPPSAVNDNNDTEAFADKGEVGEVHHITLHEVDEAAAFVSGFHGEIDPEEAHRVLRKIDWNLLPLM